MKILTLTEVVGDNNTERRRVRIPADKVDHFGPRETYTADVGPRGLTVTRIYTVSGCSFQVTEPDDEITAMMEGRHSDPCSSEHARLQLAGAA